MNKRLPLRYLILPMVAFDYCEPSSAATIVSSNFKFEYADGWNPQNLPPQPVNMAEGTRPASPTILVNYYGITGAQIIVRLVAGEQVTNARVEYLSGSAWVTVSELTIGGSYPSFGTQANDQIWYSPTRNWQLYDNPYAQEDYSFRFVATTNLGTALDDNDGTSYKVIGTVPEPSFYGIAATFAVAAAGRRRRRFPI